MVDIGKVEKVNNIEEARSLIAHGQNLAAGKMLDRLISKDRQNDELWYLRGLVSLRLKNYAGAEESLERALSIKKKAEYYKLKGIAHLQIYEIEEAIDDFLRSLKVNNKDASVYFFLSLCYIFLNDPRSREMMQNAYLLDKKATRGLIENFYDVFFKNDLGIDKRRLDELGKLIDKID